MIYVYIILRFTTKTMTIHVHTYTIKLSLTGPYKRQGLQMQCFHAITEVTGKVRLSNTIARRHTNITVATIVQPKSSINSHKECATYILLYVVHYFMYMI